MRWPWVSRLAFEQAVARAERAERLCDTTRGIPKTHEYLDGVKVQLADSKVFEWSSPPERDRDYIEEAIAAVGGADQAWRARLRVQAQQLERQGGLTDLEIAQQIHAGVELTDGVGS